MSSTKKTEGLGNESTIIYTRINKQLHTILKKLSQKEDKPISALVRAAIKLAYAS